jgi:hypothetical protein
MAWRVEIERWRAVHIPYGTKSRILARCGKIPMTEKCVSDGPARVPTKISPNIVGCAMTQWIHFHGILYL